MLDPLPIRIPAVCLLAAVATQGCGDDDGARGIACFPGETVPCQCADRTASFAPCDVTGVLLECVCFGPQGPRPPVADAGDDQTVRASEPVTLDGTASADPNGDALEYQWTFTSRPDGSTVSLEGADTSRPTFVPGAVGTFVVTLIVSDGEFESEPDTVTIIAENTPPIADAGTDQNVVTGQGATLDAGGSVDEDGDDLSYSWRISAAPEGSAASLQGGGTSSPTLIPDVDGTYELELIVNDGFEDSETAVVTVAAFRRIDALPFRVTDAEYSDALDAIVAVSSSPAALHILDPRTATASTVELPLAPTAVSVGPSGLSAAVGHNAYVTHVNLSTEAAVDTFPVAVDVFDVVLAGNGYVYAFPRVDQWVSLHSIEVQTGTETTSDTIRAGTKAKLHPGGQAIYGADNGLSPSDIERYDISGGVASYAYDSQYHGDYAMCGDLWLSRDGARIFTKCGNVFRTSDVQDEDMTYNGSLEGVTQITHLSHASTAGRVLAIPSPGFSVGSEPVEDDRVVRIYADEFLGFEREIGLPSFIVAGEAFAGHGRFVFSNAAGTDIYVVLQADGASALLDDFGLVTYAH